MRSKEVRNDLKTQELDRKWELENENGGSGEWLVASDGMTQERGKRVADSWKDRMGWEFGDVGTIHTEG